MTATGELEVEIPRVPGSNRDRCKEESQGGSHHLLGVKVEILRVPDNPSYRPEGS